MKKSILIISVISTLSILLMAGCKKRNTQTSPHPQNPTEEVGDGYVQATIDGKTLIVEEREHQYNTVSGEISGTNNNILFVSGATLPNRNDYRSINFTLKDEHPIQEGTYDVVFEDIPGLPDQGHSEQLFSTIQWKNENGGLFSFVNSLSYLKPYPSATVTISKFTNKKGEYIEGTFSIINGMHNDNMKLVSLTDGKFKVRLE